MNLRHITYRGLETRGPRSRQDAGAPSYRSFRLEPIEAGGDGRERIIAFSSDTATVMRNDARTKDNPDGLGMVPEILLHSRSAMDLSRLEVGSVLKNHDVNQIVASIEEIFPGGDGVNRARIRFTQTAKGVEAQTEVRDGALKGVSFGYDPVEFERVPKGSRYRDAETGKDYEGPCVVVTRWVALELTLTPVPADATVGVGRGKGVSALAHKKGETKMELREHVLTYCLRHGLSMKVADAVLKKAKTIEEADSLLGVAIVGAVAGVLGKTRKLKAVPRARRAVMAGGDDEESRADEADEERGEDEEETRDEAVDELRAEEDEEETDTREEGADYRSTRAPLRRLDPELVTRRERERCRNIRLLCRQFDLPIDEEREHCERGTSTESLMKLLRKKQTDSAGERVIARGGRVEQGEDAADKLVRCAEGGLANRIVPTLMAPFTERAWRKDGFTVVEGEEKSNPVREYMNSFKDVGLGRRMSCEEIARTMLRAAGYRNWNGLNRVEAINELFTPRFVTTMSTRSSAGNSVATLSNLFANVANKTLLREYKRRDPSWKKWCRTGTLTDYKPMSLVRMSDLGDYLLKAENGGFLEAAITDQAETIQLDDYGRVYSLTAQMMINDDLDAFSRMSAKMQLAAIRLVSTLVYTKLLANPTMGADSVVLFHATHGNLSTGAAFSETEVGLMLKKFRNQTAFKDTKETKPADSLDIEPELLLVPPSHEIAAQKIVNPMMMLTGADVPFKGKYEVVVEPRLENSAYSGFSATATYLIASPAVSDTFLVAFLDGDDNPRMNRVEDYEKQAIKFVNWLPCAVKPVDWRAMVKSNGA